MVWLNKIAING